MVGSADENSRRARMSFCADVSSLMIVLDGPTASLLLRSGRQVLKNQSRPRWEGGLVVALHRPALIPDHGLWSGRDCRSHNVKRPQQIPMIRLVLERLARHHSVHKALANHRILVLAIQIHR